MQDEALDVNVSGGIIAAHGSSSFPLTRVKHSVPQPIFRVSQGQVLRTVCHYCLSGVALAPVWCGRNACPVWH
ncbi:hypothetical protein GCM10011366_20180 [Ornithinimicrobium tianjinense]|uniref:Uncharacterized protein n=1 Tax=Ornithinimicrobium tianjinense TaxID=1195761 RepID=A0A917BQ49_9MICO|nr:hypothetical protein GCM10011366_20180 [Ornithinimicrobium tianjinense]